MIYGSCYIALSPRQALPSLDKSAFDEIISYIFYDLQTGSKSEADIPFVLYISHF